MDILVKEEFWNGLKRIYPPNKKGYIEIGRIEIFKEWKPWFNDPNKLIDDSDIIEGFRYVKLKYVLEWKKAMGRDKDKKDIELINKFLKENP